MIETTAKFLTDEEITVLYNAVIAAKIRARKEWEKQSVWTVEDGKTYEQAAAQLETAKNADAEYEEIRRRYDAAVAANADAEQDANSCSCVELPGGNFVTCANCNRDAAAEPDWDAVQF